MTPVRHPGGRRRRGGYTLVEMIITLAILGIMGTVVTRIMMSQQRFYSRMNEQTNVRRELRNALGTLPTELRSVSGPGEDIRTFGASSLTFRSTIGTSIVCNRASATTIEVPPTNTARTSTSNWVTAPVAGDTVYALYHDLLGVKGDYWTAHRITAVTSAGGMCAGSPFTDATLDAGKTFFRFTVTPALPDSVTAGSALRFTRSAKYELAQQTSGRWYLQRSELVNNAWTTPVVVSGPYVAPQVNGNGGVAFTYFDSTGAAVPSGGVARNIARIDVALRALGQAGSDRLATVPNDSIRLSIAVRNRR